MANLKLIKRQIITPTLFEVFFDAKEVSHTFKIPGQYCVVNLPEAKALYLVLSNHIGCDTWSFLVRDANASSSVLLKAAVGSQLDVSEAQGNGYPMEKLKGSHVVLFSAGTGLASFRSVLNEIVKNRDEYKDVFLLHGSRYENEIPYQNDIKIWKYNNIDVCMTLSKPSDNWSAYKGYVQEILNTKKMKLDGFSGLICGPMAMVEDVTKVANEHGLKSELIYSNY